MECPVSYFRIRPQETACQVCPKGTISDAGEAYCMPVKPGFRLKQAHDRRLDRFWCFQTGLGHTKAKAASRSHSANEMPRPQDRATRMRAAVSWCVTTPQTIGGLCTPRHGRPRANTTALHTPKYSSDLPLQDTTATRRRHSPAWLCGRRMGH